MPVEKKTWVLLRGLAREARHWGDFVPEMQKAFPEDQIITLDLPGAGEFCDYDFPLDVSQAVKFLREKLSARSPQHPVYLLAVSLGGMVALEWMRSYPQEVSGGVVMNSSLSNLSPFYQRLRWEVYGLFFTKIIFLRGAERERQILSVISQQTKQHEIIAQTWAQWNQESPMRLTNILRQIYAAAHYRLTEAVQQPCLLLVGSGDRLVHPLCSEKIHQKFKYPINRHPWAGHDLTLDDGSWVTQRILDWVLTL